MSFPLRMIELHVGLKIEGSIGRMDFILGELEVLSSGAVQVLLRTPVGRILPIPSIIRVVFSFGNGY